MTLFFCVFHGGTKPDKEMSLPSTGALCCLKKKKKKKRQKTM
jgi:hypothetical protein